MNDFGRFEAAWLWYRAAAEACQLFGELERFWPDLQWQTVPLPSGRLRTVEGPEFRELAANVRQPLDDLAVLYLFSVFEATVRDFVRSQVDPEIRSLNHAALKKAGEDLQITLDEGSFSKVMALVKGIDGDLAEQVNQIRQHRNWLAHGKKSDREPRNRVGSPREVYDRLRRFLQLLQEPDNSTS